MADFTLVDPKGWEYDLHSVCGLQFAIASFRLTVSPLRYTLRISAIFKYTMCHGMNPALALDCRPLIFSQVRQIMGTFI